MFLPGESQGRGSLVGCRLWGRTESDTTEATQQQQQKQTLLCRANPIHPVPTRDLYDWWAKNATHLCACVCLYDMWDPGNIQFSSFSRLVMSDSLWPHELQQARPPCPSPTPGVHPNSCPLSRWCHPTILSSVVPFSSCPQSFPASGSFPVSQLFASGGQSIGVSASTSVLPMNTQDWSPLG